MLIVKEIYPKSNFDEEMSRVSFQKRKVNPKADDIHNYGSSNAFVSKLHVYKCNQIYGLGAMQDRNFRHRTVLKTLYAENNVKLKALNSTPSYRLM